MILLIDADGGLEVGFTIGLIAPEQRHILLVLLEIDNAITLTDAPAGPACHVTVQGRVKRNVEPRPGVLSAQILPP
jgi:hypothetical protein